MELAVLLGGYHGFPPIPPPVLLYSRWDRVAVGYVRVRAAGLLADQAERIAAELEWVEGRLASLGDSEEDRVEAIVLRALKRHLEGELAEISGYLAVWDWRPGGEVAAHA